LTAIGSPEFDGKMFGPKVLQENHPCGPGLIFADILIFSHLLRDYAAIEHGREERILEDAKKPCDFK